MTIDALAAILIAPFVGSFLGLVIDRLPEGRPVLIGRSTCDHCGRSLASISLIPIISYLLQRGRCRDCGKSIRRFHLFIELLAVVVAIGAALLLSGWVLWVSLYLGWSLLVLAAIDLRHHILPDPINLPLTPIGLATIFFLEPSRLSTHVIGAVLGFSALWAVGWTYRRLRGRDGIGIGDAKLFCAAGSWLGLEALPGVLLAAALAGLVYALARSLIGDRVSAVDEIAFGPYLALAIWSCWLFGPIIFW